MADCVGGAHSYLSWRVAVCPVLCREVPPGHRGDFWVTVADSVVGPEVITYFCSTACRYWLSVVVWWVESAEVAYGSGLPRVTGWVREWWFWLLGVTE